MYEGTWHLGKPYGNGRFSYAEGDLYIGKFYDGNYRGFGKYHHVDGGHQEGFWKINLLNGIGK